MITRRHVKGNAPSVAVYSPCEGYRYRLSRTWDPSGSTLLYVMLNPSTATEVQNDPTIERCERRARALGYGGMSICNIFAWRETHPARLRRAADPVGPDNDSLLQQAAHQADLVLCAWGVHGDWMGRGPTVAKLLAASGRPLAHLGLTKHGHPRHPLYVAYSVAPIVWNIEAR